MPEDNQTTQPARPVSGNIDGVKPVRYQTAQQEAQAKEPAAAGNTNSVAAKLSGPSKQRKIHNLPAIVIALIVLAALVAVTIMAAAQKNSNSSSQTSTSRTY